MIVPAILATSEMETNVSWMMHQKIVKKMRSRNSDDASVNPDSPTWMEKTALLAPKMDIGKPPMDNVNAISALSQGTENVSEKDT